MGAHVWKRENGTSINQGIKRQSELTSHAGAAHGAADDGNSAQKRQRLAPSAAAAKGSERHLNDVAAAGTAELAGKQPPRHVASGKTE